MNILMLLKPKDRVELIYSSFTIRQALEKMRAYKYSSMPIIDKESGKYIGTISTGDILFYIAEHYLPFTELETIPLSSVEAYRSAKPISIDTNIECLYDMILEENFVPVIDSRGVFIGIITRKSVIHYLLQEKNGN